jgi:putative SOS response-associated peptidase YedK
MCYSAEAAIKAELDYATHRGDNADRVAELLQRLKDIQTEKYWHVSGFSHPKILVFTDKDPYNPQAFNWGLIPSWVKDWDSAKKLRTQTLNARGETIFEKPSFRTSAKSKRCLVYLDAFYEHHHIGKNTFPFRISLKSNEPMIIAGLWEEWVNKETGEILPTFTIVTTSGNQIMATIHNNPKAEIGPRMPVILSKEDQDAWLDSKASQKDIEALIKPCDENLLKFHTVNRINGKAYIGNKPEIREPFKYAEVEWA